MWVDINTKILTRGENIISKSDLLILIIYDTSIAIYQWYEIVGSITPRSIVEEIIIEMKLLYLIIKETE